MLNPLQGLPQARAATPLERVGGVAEVAACEAALPVAADAVTRYWDELFAAVCARLTQLAEHSTEPSMQAGVSDCVAALAQLGAALGDGIADKPTTEPEIEGIKINVGVHDKPSAAPGKTSAM